MLSEICPRYVRDMYAHLAPICVQTQAEIRRAIWRQDHVQVTSRDELVLFFVSDSLGYHNKF